MKPLLLLDFDSTLFKTTDFWDDFAVVFARVSGEPESKYVNHYFDMTSGEGRLRGINYDKLLSDAHIAEKSVRRAAKKQMVHKSYIFDDAQALIDKLPLVRQTYDVAILTFGQPPFQNLKIEHTPEITGIPVYITQELKTEYIQQHFFDRSYGVLVDDKFGQQLPAGWLELHIDRTAKQYQSPRRLGDNIVRITSLDDVIDCIDLQ